MSATTDLSNAKILRNYLNILECKFRYKRRVHTVTKVII